MDLQTRREHYNRCRVDEALDWNDERNVDIDHLPTRVRGENWAERLATTIQLSTEPVRKLISGLRGSGKSTELRRLVHVLDDRQSNLLVVSIDGDKVLDLRATIDVPDILAAVVHACERAVLDLEGADVDRELRQGYLKRLWNWLLATRVSPQQIEVSIDDTTNLLVEMRANAIFRQQVRRIISKHRTVFVENVHRELRTLRERAYIHGRRGLVVLFDSLEHLASSTDDNAEVLGSAMSLFSCGAPALDLPIHAVYTVPPALLSRQNVRVEFMPVVKLHDRQGKRHLPGYAAARQLVRRRVRPAILEEVLGSTWEERVEDLICWSGGCPGELVRLLSELLLAEPIPLDATRFRRILAGAGDNFRRLVRDCDCEWLAQVAVNHTIAADDEVQQGTADRMLSCNAVLHHLDESEWFDLHPAVYTIEGVRSAIARRRANLEMRSYPPLDQKAAG